MSNGARGTTEVPRRVRLLPPPSAQRSLHQRTRRGRPRRARVSAIPHHLGGRACGLLARLSQVPHDNHSFRPSGALRTSTQGGVMRSHDERWTPRPGCSGRPAWQGRASVFQQLETLLSFYGRAQAVAQGFPASSIKLCCRGTNGRCAPCNTARFQLQPLVEPQPSQT
jgi:hypothetical protein